MSLPLAIADIDWLWATAKWVGLVGGGVLLAWALFWDRARGRPRCPKCWYDMAGARPAGNENAKSDAETPAGPFTCPECGKTVKRWAGLLRTRRHPWLAAAAVLLLTLGYAGSRQAVYQREGSFVAFIPTTVLVLTVDPQWLWDGPTRQNSDNTATKKFANRAHRAVVDRFSRSNSLHSWAFAKRASGKLRFDLSSDSVSRDYWIGDLAPTFTETIRSGTFGGGYSEYTTKNYDSNAFILLDLVQSNIYPYDWIHHGGSKGATWLLGDRLLVRAPHSYHEEIESLLHALRNAPDWPRSESEWIQLLGSNDQRCLAKFTADELENASGQIPGDPSDRYFHRIDLLDDYFDCLDHPDRWYWASEYQAAIFADALYVIIPCKEAQSMSDAAHVYMERQQQ